MPLYVLKLVQSMFVIKHIRINQITLIPRWGRWGVWWETSLLLVVLKWWMTATMRWMPFYGFELQPFMRL